MESFQDPKRLLHTLIAAWEEMTKLHARSMGGEVALQEEAHSASTLALVNGWNAKKEANKCEEHLKKLVKVRLDLAKRSMTPRAWPVLYLSKLPVQNYLKWVVEVSKERSANATQGAETHESSEFIKVLMQQLVDPSDLHLMENFPDKHCISKWLYQSDQVETILPLECKDFLTLQDFLKQALDNLYIATGVAGAPANQKAQVHATTHVAQVVNHLRNHLLKANQKYEDVFIVTLLYPFKYDASEKIFFRLLSTEDLEYLIKNLGEQSTEFFRVKEVSLSRKQAYLFYLAINIFDSSAGIDISESHMKHHLSYMQKTLEKELVPQVESAINNNFTDSETGYNWSAIQSELLSLMSGLNLPLDCEGPTLEDLLEVTSEAPTDDISIAVQSTAAHGHTKLQCTEFQIKAFQALLEMVKLEKYYPQKLGPKDAVCIRQETLKRLQYTELPELLPYYIMQKIMMHNYKSRASILRNTQNSDNTDTDSDDSESEVEDDQINDTHSDSDNYEDCMSETDQMADIHSDCDNHDEDSSKLENGQMSDAHKMTDAHFKIDDKNEDSESHSDKVHFVHPMDGLLALIHCADNFLRQDLMAKLSTCKLAIPLLLPDPKAQILTFPLWSMRTIIKEWKSKKSDMESRIVDCKTPIASFLRFSESEMSKSKILNDVIGDSGHDFFFHWDCEGGTSERILVDGLVEVCWYLPAGKESDHFPDIVTFTNLHGDAREHDKQTTFLSQVSFINFVLLTQRDLEDQNGVKLLQDLAKAPGGLVLMFSDAKQDDKVKISRKMLSRKTYSKLKLKKENAAAIKNEVRRQIMRRLDQHSAGDSKQLRLTDCAEIARKIGIDVDEHVQECKQGKQLATDLVAEITSLDTDSNASGSVKEKMLPLQGPTMWHEWAKQDKEQHRHLKRGSKGVDQYNSEKEMGKLAIRRKQFERTNSTTPVMKLFIQVLLQHKGTIREYFLQWLKLLLDDRSRSLLPGLRRKYNEQRKAMNELKDISPTSKTLKIDLHKLNEQLLHTSFGLEHLLRELGQIYEAVMDVSKIKPTKQLQSKIFHLPQVAAELLVSGCPLELMDGDISHVPLTWISSILDQVQKILGDKRLFVISVLGIQSTGKSTLLNTTFGLQFTVSAGRCTRGAFIQLLQINEQLQETVKCDYFLIVDTEGLRPPELDSVGTQKHDNEMATFVIGLADVTIINIFGEVPGDMDDILQTATHAFLRMRNVELKPSCQFVHQNVAAISADTKGKMGRNQFYEKLDEMTRAAAKEEQCEGQYQSFKDVITFDDERDIWHFPTLWNGDPPMAPVNPGYSDMAQALKCGLVSLATQIGSQCTISGFQLRVKQLWRAVLDENFIFSFKNTLEITAYNELDAEYTQWSWKFQRKMLELEQENEIVIRSSTFDEINDLGNTCIAKSKKLLREVHYNLELDMKKFFQKNRYRAILEQWQHQTERKLADLRTHGEAQAEEHCKTLVRSREAYVSIEKMQGNHREELRKYVIDLVSQLEGNKLSEEEQESMFEDKWGEWMHTFTARLPKVYQEEVKIDTSIENCLRTLFRKHDQKIRHTSLQRQGKHLKLAIQEHKHLQSRRWWGIKHLCDEDIEDAKTMNKKFLETAEQYLQDLKKRHIQYFSDAFVVDLFNKVLEGVDHSNKENLKYKFTEEYKVDISLTVGGYALHHFEEMMKVIRKENDPIEYLKTLKVPFLKTFKNQYSQIAKEKTAADNLCYLLKTSIVTAVTGSLGRMIVDDMKTRPMFHSKRALKAKILLDLKKESFKSFALYLTDVKVSIQEWVKFYTKQHCAEPRGGKSRLEELSEAKLLEVVVCISDTARDVTKSLPLPKQANINDWLKRFHRQLSSVLALNLDEIKEVVGVEDLNNFHYFTEEIIGGFRKMQVSLLEDFQRSPLSQMDRWSKQPHDILYDTLLGCCEQCPFCKEQCELTTPNHDCKHSVELHRPGCLAGYRSVSTGRMTLDICTSLVASNAFFGNHDTGKDKFHPYRKYRMYYPNWIITPDNSLQASSYWKWFVANYSAQIAHCFNMKEKEIPDAWTIITWEKVERDLKTSYNL